MHLAGASVCLTLVLLVVDELCAHPENSVRRVARDVARVSARDVASVVTFVLCLPVFAVFGFGLALWRRARSVVSNRWNSARFET